MRADSDGITVGRHATVRVAAMLIRPPTPPHAWRGIHRRPSVLTAAADTLARAGLAPIGATLAVAVLLAVAAGIAVALWR